MTLHFGALTLLTSTCLDGDIFIDVWSYITSSEKVTSCSNTGV